jgi:hypothetical protein
MYNQASSSATPRNEVTVDPYALFEALTGRKMPEATPSSPRTISEDYDDLLDVQSSNSPMGQVPKPDSPPKDIAIGAINPFALTEALVGHRLERNSRDAARIISDVLQTDYDELFDLKHRSVLYAGLRLDSKQREAEELKKEDMKILEERDLVSPDLSRIETLQDLEKVGLKGLGNTRVKVARLQNGKLRLVIDGHTISRTVSNNEVTMSINELATRFRRIKSEGHWSPPNSTWRDAESVMRYNRVSRDMIDDFRRIGLREGLRGYLNSEAVMGNTINLRNQCHNVLNRFDDPVQGASSNSWLIAAIFSVFWANPTVINRATHGINRDFNREETEDNERRRKNQTIEIKFHDKGGRQNAKTRTVEVNYEIPINNSSMDPVYAHSSDRMDMWPSLYEKAFAKWITNDDSERPDITQTAYGDPIKAMAQINGREPQYYYCERHHHKDLLGLVRACSVNFKTIHPMAAYTHASGSMYRGANLVANHAYSVLGWCQFGDRQYIIMRNPWGITEPLGLNSYPGLLDRVEPEFWRPACMLDNKGLLALECSAFKELFAVIGVAK